MNTAKLRWRCRRGVKEFDVLFNQFLEMEYQTLTEEQKVSFHTLLDKQDPLIMDWLLNRSKPKDAGLKWIIGRLQRISKNITKT